MQTVELICFDAFSQEKRILRVVFWSHLWQNKANFFHYFMLLFSYKFLFGLSYYLFIPF